MITNYILSAIASLIGLQVFLPELKLLTGKYNYKIQLPNIVCYIAFLLIIGIMLLDINNGCNFFLELAFAIMGVFISACSEFIISRMDLKRVPVFCLRLFVAVFIYWLTTLTGTPSFLAAVMSGLYIRNCIFGVPYGKDLCISFYMKRNYTEEIGTTEFFYRDCLPDYSYAGNHNPIPLELKRYNVTEYGIAPNTTEDIMPKLQSLIDKAGRNGGGIIYFPGGRYLCNNKGKGLSFLQINYSNIVMEGELDIEGKPLAEIVSCRSTVNGKKYPWLSPFFITTGEKIQASNIFWGLNFRKDRYIKRQSDSLSDPGSDGRILSPEFSTKIIADAKSGTDVIRVEDTSTVSKYALIGLYNTTDDGNLIKDILGINTFPEYWMNANRAGIEEAPSFQWLVEITERIDNHSLRLSRPLFRDILMKYEPAIYNVEMLENICIRNLRLSTTWNGLFHHHGFALYYNVKQAQDMDYGWNGINMRRVAHGNIENVIFKNFTNPIYLFDSRNVTVQNIVTKGYDGHQGLKIYMHTCDCLYKDITMYNHYADMIGGEGNAYTNVFCNVRYLNPNFKPGQYDFHGFSECPMSPPAYNLFDNVFGFKNVKMSGPLYNQPACAQHNVWYNNTTEGEQKGEPFFTVYYLRKRFRFMRFLSSFNNTITYAIHKKEFDVTILKNIFREFQERKKKMEAPASLHHTYFINSHCYGISTECSVQEPRDNIVMANMNERYSKASLYVSLTAEKE